MTPRERAELQLLARATTGAGWTRDDTALACLYRELAHHGWVSVVEHQGKVSAILTLAGQNALEDPS